MSRNRSFVLGLVFVVLVIPASSIVAKASWGLDVFGSISDLFGVTSSREKRDENEVSAPTVSNGPVIFQRGFSAAFDIPYNRGGQLFKIDPATGTESLFGDGSQPNYSPAGSKVVFLSNTHLTTSAIGTYNPIGLTILGGGSPISGLYPKWSPDGANIAYNTITSVNGTFVYHINIIGGTCTACDIGQQLNPTGTNAYIFPAWNPVVNTSGASRTAQLIYVRTSATADDVDAGNFTGDIFSEMITIAANGTVTEGSKTNLTNSPAHYAFPSYSHDGTKISFVKFNPDDSSSLFVMNANGSNAAAILNYSGTGNSFVHHPAWSPNDTKIVFSDTNQLLQITTDPSHQVTPVTSVTNAEIDLWPTWSPGAAACITPPTGMTGWYQAEGNANDSSDNANNGSLLGGASFTAGQIGQAFNLNGTTAGVQIPDAAGNKPTLLTVDTWVKFNSLNSTTSSPGLQYLVFKKNTRTSGFEAYTLLKDRTAGVDKLGFIITGASGTQASIRSNTVVVPGVWYHVAGTYDGTAARLYVNGVQEAAAAATFALDYSTRPLFLGSSGETFDGKVNGLLDDVHLFNRALTSAEIQAIYLSGTCNVPPPTPTPTPTPTPNPVPTIKTDGTGLSPSSAVTGGSGFTLTVNGTNFMSSSTVTFNNANRPTTFVSTTKLTAQIPSTDIAAAGIFPVTVVNPAPGGGPSNAVDFTVSAMALSFDGRIRDRVSKSESGTCSNTQAPPPHSWISPICDGDSDGTFSVAISSVNASKLITKVDVMGENGNRWDTTPGNGLWVVGVARGLDAPFENQADGSLNGVPVSNQGTFKLFVPDSIPTSFAQGKTFTLTVTFSDNTTLTATTTVQQTPTWDIGVSIKGPTATKTVGDRFSYAVSIKNYGTALATNIHFAEQLPSSVKLVGLEPSSTCPDQSKVGQNGPLVTCAFNQLDPGQSTSILMTVQAVAAGELSTTASVTAQVSEPSPDPHSNSASVSTTIVRPTDLAITMTGPKVVNSVDKINYSIDITNKSNPGQDAFGTVLTANIPSNATYDSTDSAALGCSGVGTTFTCTLNFAISSGTTIHIRFAIRALHTSESSSITTTAHVSSTNPDSNLMNNDAAPPPTAVKIGSDLEITMSGPAQVSDGSNITYAIRVTNHGPSTNLDAWIADQIPDNTDFVSATPSPGANPPACGLNMQSEPDPGDPNYLQCSLGSIQIGTTYQVNLTVHPRMSGTITNSATVILPSEVVAQVFGISPDDVDGNPTNNTASFSTQTCVTGNGALPHFEVPEPTKLAAAGTRYTYRVRATDNNGGRVRYSLSQGPQGMTIANMGDGTALIQWTPDSSLIGTHRSVTVIASILAADGSPLCNGSASKTFDLEVTQPIPPGGYCITNGAVKICSDAIVPASGQKTLLAQKIAKGELRPEDFPSGTYTTGGNTLLGNYLLFTGSVTLVVDRNAATLKLMLSGGSLILKGIPILGDQTLWTGDNLSFTFDANGTLTQFLQTQTDQLKLAGCKVHITAAKLLLNDSDDLGIDITGSLIFPDIATVKGLSASFSHVFIRQKTGIHFTGHIAIPDFKAGGFGIQNASMDFVASPDGMHDVFTGGGTLVTPALTVIGEVQFIGGRLDRVCASISGAAPGLPIPPFFNLTGGGIGIAGLQGGPVPQSLCGLDTSAYGIPSGFSMFIVADVTIGEASVANIIKLSRAGLIYTAPNKIAIVSDLDILTTKAASAAIGLEVPYNVSIGASVSLLDNYKVFELGGRTLSNGTRAPLFAAGARDDGAGHLLFFMSASAEAKVQIPPMPNPPLPQPGPFIYGLAGAAGVKFPVIVAKVGVGFDYPPGNFSADVTFPIIDTVNVVVENTQNAVIAEIGTKFGSLPPINFKQNSTYVTTEQTKRSSTTSGPVYYPGTEGLHIPQATAAVPLDLGSYVVPPDTPKLAFDLSGGAPALRYDLTMPDNTVITPDNASVHNVVFLQNDDLNSAYYVISNPAAGTWSVQAEDGTQGPFVLNAFGANAPPILTSVSASQTGSSVQINYDATDADDNAPVSLFYTKSSADSNGTPIAEGLPKSSAGSYNWNTNTGTIPSGDYYVYAMISDGKNVPQTKFATTKITIVDPQAPATPQNVLVKTTAGNSLVVSWTANTESDLGGYNVLYDIDLGDGAALTKSFDAGTDISVRLPRLQSNTPYRVSVVAYRVTASGDTSITHTSPPSAPLTATTGIAVPPMVTVTSPNGGDVVSGNEDMTISWTLAQGGAVVNQTVELSTDGGSTYALLTGILDGAARNYIWHVPSTLAATTARVRVTALDSSGNAGTDASNANFTIVAEGDPTPTPTPTPSPTPAVVYGDVGPRPNGDGILLSNDATIERAFVVGNLVPSAGELTRADCAPKATHGDGILTAGDTIQVRRYVSGLDTQGTIEEPTSMRETDLRTGVRTIRVVSEIAESGSKVSVPVELIPNGDELAAAVTLNFDPAKLKNPVVQLASGVSDKAVLTVNTNEAETGKLMILVDSGAALGFSKKPQQLFTISFDVNADAAGTAELSLGTSRMGNSVADVEGNLLPTNFIPGSVTISPATAQVSGRILTADGIGVRNAQVTLTDSRGVPHTTTTGSFGYYSFDGVPVGKSVAIAVSSKRYYFEPQTMTIVSGTSNADFVAK